MINEERSERWKVFRLVCIHDDAVEDIHPSHLLS